MTRRLVPLVSPWLALALLVWVPGCAPMEMAKHSDSVEIEPGPPISGEALQQRKRELRRAMRDAVHIGA